MKLRHGIAVIETGDLSTDRGITDKLELWHQFCHFHKRRWVGRACWELGQRLDMDWLRMIECIKVITEDPPPDGGRQLLDQYRQVPFIRKDSHNYTAMYELCH